jgi:hypothetical protein
LSFLDDDNEGVLEPNDTMPPTPAVAATLAETEAETPTTPRSDVVPDTAAGSTTELSLPPGAPAIDDVVESMFADAIPTIPGRPSTRLPMQVPTMAAPPEPARPLPSSGGDALEPEARSVLPRTAVGATAWSSRKAPDVVDDQGGWEDVEAADVSLGQPLPHIVKAALTEPTADMPALTPGPAALTLAQDLGLSEDELALAIREADPSFASGTLPVLTSTSVTEQPPTTSVSVSAAVVAQAAATETPALLGAAAHEDLARRIAAQLDDHTNADDQASVITKTSNLPSPGADPDVQTGAAASISPTASAPKPTRERGSRGERRMP